jgi:Undecaprenyl-phosphate glucose phosphotransferase
MAELISPSSAAAVDGTNAKIQSNPYRLRTYQALTIVGFCDFLVIAVVGAIGIVFVTHVYPQITPVQYATLWLIISISSLLCFVGSGCYRTLPSDFRAQLPTLFIGFSLPILLVTFVLFSLKVGEAYSRGWIIGWWATGLIALAVDRLAAERVRSDLVNRGHLTEKYAIFGADESARAMIERLKRHRGIEIVSIFDDRRTRVPPEIAGIPVGGGIAELAHAAQDSAIDRVIITLPTTAGERIRDLAKTLYPLPLQIDVGVDALHGKINFRRGSLVAGSLLLELYDRPLGDWRYVVKACEDKLIAAVVLLLISPLLAAIALAIKIDSPGPVLFRQKRYGFTGKIFEVLKFRTMYVDKADPLGEQLTQRNDPRVTRIGHYLRRTSLDELPQIFNVLRNEMSLVGPRPHPLSAKAANIRYQDAIDHYALRHRVKPGMTGWAQVNGWRGETETLVQLQKRVEYDLFYIEHWSLWLDLQILARTACCFFRTKNTF